MSRPNCNSARTLAIVTVALLAGCAHQVETQPAATSMPGANKVGYVRMEPLLKAHPLYGQLAHLDDDVAALQLQAVGSDLARSGSDIAAQERALQTQLETAAKRTNAALAQKQQEYGKREQAAIDAALAAAGLANGSNGGSIAGGIASVSRTQAQAAQSAANANLLAYRRQVLAQDQQAETTLQRSLNERASRSFRARAEALSKKEADFAYQLAQADSAQRLALRTKMSNLALDDSSRDDTKKQLDALAQSEADQLAAMKNRDQATLVAYQKQLHDQIQGDLDRQVAQIRSRSVADIGKRVADTRGALAGQIGSVPGAAIPASGVTPDLRAKLTALHAKFAGDYRKDAQTTIAQFQKTRSDLTARFRELEGADGSAQTSAGREIDALRRQRADLYAQMVAQIDREVKTIAERRGVSVVVSQTVAPADGVDLTADAQKDIESLHE